MAADTVVYDYLAETALPCDLPPRVSLHSVGKRAGDHPMPQEEINALLVRLAREGKRVARLKGGDPYVFGRGGEEAEALVKAGVAFEVIPVRDGGRGRSRLCRYSRDPSQGSGSSDHGDRARKCQERRPAGSLGSYWRPIDTP